MSWSSFIFPRFILKTTSAFNRDIRVVEEGGKNKLLVNGSRQSGEYIKLLWGHAFSQFNIYPSPDIKRILVLGVAGGTVIHLLRTIYPDADIEGVDIDEEMIRIGRKYFDLGEFRITNADANAYVASARKRWHVIIIDLYIGASIPSFVADPIFLRNVHRSLLPGGKAIINYLYEYEYKTLSDLLLVKLKETFSEVKDTKIYNNRFFYVVK